MKEIYTLSVKGVDNTFGSKILSQIAINNYNCLPEGGKVIENRLCEEFKKAYNEGDWLINLICQYNWYSYSLGDILWYKHLKRIMLEGELFMRIFEIPNFAFNDKRFEENVKNLDDLNISISNDKKNSDGLWTMKDPLELYKVYPNDEETPDKETDIDSIEIGNPFGVVEFGTQEICKSVSTLLMNNILLRVPYKTNTPFMKPVCAFFFSTTKKMY